MHSLRLSRILTYAAVICGALAFVTLTPIAKNAYEDHREQQEKLRYSTGLYPCNYDWIEFSEYIDSHLLGQPDVSIDVFPTFDDPQAIRVVGRDIYYFRVGQKLLKQISDRSGKGHAYIPERADVTRSAFLVESSEMLVNVLTREIINAGGEEPMGLDGTVYKFKTSETNRCGMAWSPGTEDRAYPIVGLYYSALNYTVDSKDHPITQQQLHRQIRDLLDQ